MPIKFWLLLIVCSIAPDADVLAFDFDIPYGHFFGHRGFFHSPFFALLVSLFIVCIFFQNKKLFSRSWYLLVLYFFLVTASHGLLDACTSGGLGIALLSPLTNTRFFFPFRPIRVSDIGTAALFTRRAVTVLVSEAIFVWIPLLALTLLNYSFRKINIRKNHKKPLSNKPTIMPS